MSVDGKPLTLSLIDTAHIRDAVHDIKAKHDEDKLLLHKKAIIKGAKGEEEAMARIIPADGA